MRSESRQRAVAYGILSLLIHLSVFLGAQRQPVAFRFAPSASQPPDRDAMPRLFFVATRPGQESETPPDRAETYSDRQTLASQPEPSEEPAEEAAPRLDGEDPRSIATDSGQPDAGAPGPDEAPAPVETAESEPPDPSEPIEIGSGIRLAAEAPGPASDRPAPAIGTEADRPVSGAPYADLPQVKGARAEATVSRRGVLAHDTLRTAFGAYDRKLFAAIGRRWIELVRPHFYGERSGEVVVQFEITAAGELDRLEIVHETSGPALAGFCLKAIRDCSPFAPLPDEVMNLLSADRREFQVRFLY